MVGQSLAHCRAHVLADKKAAVTEIRLRLAGGVRCNGMVGQKVQQLDIGGPGPVRLQSGDQAARRGAGGADEDMLARP